MFIDLRILYHPCIPGMNPTWSWWMIFLMYCWMCFANILLRILASMFISDIGLKFSVFVILYLVLGLGWCWLHRKSLGVFRLLGFFEIVCEGWALALSKMFCKVLLWNCLVQGFCVTEIFWVLLLCHRLLLVCLSFLLLLDSVLKDSMFLEIHAFHPGCSITWL